MNRRVWKTYTSILLICIMLCGLVLQNVYAFGIPAVMGQGKIATASDATSSDATASDAALFSHWDETVSMTAEAGMDEGDETEIYLYLKNNGNSWIMDGDLSCVTETQGEENYFVAVEELGEDGEWTDAVFPEDVIGYDTEDLREPELFGIALRPGTAYRMTYHYTWEDTGDEEELAEDLLEFRFKGKDESGKRQTAQTFFCYHIDGWNLGILEPVVLQAATDSDASFTVDVNGWLDMLLDQDETATASDAAADAKYMGLLSWSLTADAGLKNIKAEDNGDGTVTFCFDLDEDTEAGVYFAEISAAGKYNKKMYRTSAGMYFIMDGEMGEQATEYRYEDGEVTVEAIVTAERGDALLYGSELIAEKVTDADRLREIEEKIDQTFGQTAGRNYECSRVYDIHFEYEGEEIEPVDADVQIRMRYQEAVRLYEAVKQAAEPDVRVLHLSDEGVVEDVTDEIMLNAEGDVEAAGFETAGLSVFVLAQGIPSGTTFRYEDDTVSVTANVSETAGIPADARLVVERLGEEEERFLAAKARLEELKEQENQDGKETAQTLNPDDLMLYEFYFMDSRGEKITLDAAWAVQMDFAYQTAKPRSRAAAMAVSAYGAGEGNAGADHETKAITVYQITEDQALKEVSGTAVVAGTDVQRMSVEAGGTGMLGVARDSYPPYLFDVTEYDGEYTIPFILQHYNIYTKENAVTGHMIGPVAVGGKGSFGQGIGGAGYVHRISSYVKGGFIKFNSFYSVYDPQDKNTARKLYLDNINQLLSNAIPRWAWEWEPSATSDQGAFRIKQNYMDFGEAFQEVESQVALFHDYDDLKTVDLNKLYYQKLPGGGTDNVLTLDLHEGNVYYIEKIDQIPRINVVGSKKANVIVYSEERGSVDLPSVTINTTDKLSSAENDAEGIGLIFVFPNATDVYVGNQNNKTPGGHVIAPNAIFHKESSNGQNAIGDYNGCVIAKAIDAPAVEFHMHPYNQGLLNAGVRFKVGKTVDNKVPASGQKFTFSLQEAGRDGRPSGSKKTSQNALNEVVFAPVHYAEEGDYYYIISEEVEASNDKYTFDTSRYFIHVVVERIEDPVTSMISIAPSKVVYWKIDDKGVQMGNKTEAVLPNRWSAASVVDFTAGNENPLVFRNKTKLSVVLPETGGTAATKLLNTSLWLFTFGLVGMGYSCRTEERRTRRRRRGMVFKGR